MPAEWEPHRATWIAWPHLESDFPGKLQAVQWVYTEIVRQLSQSEQVEVLCATAKIKEQAQQMLNVSGIVGDFRLHVAPYHRSWLRDSAPSCVIQDGKPAWVEWQFNAWAKYDDFKDDLLVPKTVAQISKRSIIKALRSDNGEPFVMEGGAFDVDGQGTVMVTEQCLLSKVQERNPGLTREGYEEAFKRYLGAAKTIWLSGSCEGDDTHGHIDDVARFVGVGKVVVMAAAKGDSEYEEAAKNIAALKAARDNRGGRLEVIELPFPEPIYVVENGEKIRLPASYANFYIGNSVVLVPTFNDPKDREVLGVLGELFPGRRVVGIHAVDYVLGFGTLHCSTQQEAAISVGPQA
jgi:agmatine deiminase